MLATFLSTHLSYAQAHADVCSHLNNYTVHFIMFSVITNICNKKTKGPTLMQFFTATGKLKKFFFYNYRCSMCAPRVTRHTSI